MVYRLQIVGGCQFAGGVGMKALTLSAPPELGHDLGRILKHRCRYDGEWIIRRGGRWFYTLKALIAVLLRREWLPSGYCCESGIEVAYLAGGSSYIPGEPTTYWADVLYVPRGVRSWRFAIEQVSS